MKSIKTKLIIYFSVLILLSSVILGASLLIQSSNALEGDAEGALESLTIEASNLTEARVETQKQALEIIAGMLDIQMAQLLSWEIEIM